MYHAKIYVMLIKKIVILFIMSLLMMKISGNYILK